jgi:ABC-type multidrug transport system fused ATPase/permease subunit
MRSCKSCCVKSFVEFRGNTRLVVARRLSSVLNAASILVMGPGRVLETGAPEMLLADANGQLSRMRADAVI